MRPRLLTVLCVTYVAFVMYASLMPFDLRPDWGQAKARLARAGQFWPFGPLRASRTDLASNLALYLPLGLLVAARGTARRGSARLPAALGALLASLAVSLLVEGLQLLSSSRVSGAHDVLMNALGGSLGGIFGAMAGRPAFLRLRLTLRQRWARRPTSLVALVLLAVLAAEALFPFRPTLDVSEVARNVRSSVVGLSDALAARPWYYWLFWRAGVYAVLVVLLALPAAAPSGARWLRGAAIAVGFAAAAELAKVFVISRSGNIANVLLSACGAVLAAALGAAATACWRRRRPPQPSTEAAGRALPAAEAPPPRYGRTYFVLLVIYCGLTVYGSLVPLKFRHVPFEQAARRFRTMPYLHLSIHSRADLVANLLLFIPLTFLAMGAITREGRRSGKAFLAVAVAGAAALLSAAIEFAQIYFPQRTVSFNDILSETVGGFAGVVVWFLCGRRVTQWARGLRAERAEERLAVKLLGGYAVLLIVYQLFPFDVIVSLAELRGKLGGAKLILIPFADRASLGAYGVLSTIAVMIPIGFLLAIRHRRRRAVWTAAWQTGGLALLIEVAQLLIYSRYSSSTDVVLGAIGGLLGAGASRRFGPAGSRCVLQTAFWARHGHWIKRVAAAGWIAGLAGSKCYPFSFRWPPEGLAAAARRALAVPFARQYFLPEHVALSQVVREFTTFFILGLFLRGLASGSGKAGKLACGLGVVALAGALEFVQVFVRSRTADLTAAAVGAAGGVLGVCLFPRLAEVFLAADGRSQEGEAGP